LGGGGGGGGGVGGGLIAATPIFPVNVLLGMHVP
jgi:hypothetical protein